VGLRQSPGSGDFDAFYRDCRPRVVRAMVLTLNDQDLAVDATDEAMARAFRDWATVSAHDNPSGWVYRVALNWARNRLRRRGREVSADRVADCVSVSAAPGMDPVLDEAVRALSLKLRSVIVLRYYLDWSTEQVASALGVPKGTVKSRLHRALQQLSTALEHEQ
jgi:RNA polymerase sigma-70 factor (ECF subfamily)